MRGVNPAKNGNTIAQQGGRSRGLLTLTKQTVFTWLLCFLVGDWIGTSLIYANPMDGQVVGGTATITTPTPSTVEVHQATDKAIIDWGSFNIAPHETTQFNQPSASSITLNRVDPRNGTSNILGTLRANGNVWLINPAGIFFGNTAVVDVGGLLAATANISNQDFMSGNYHFLQSPDWNGAVINQGIITIAENGLAALVAPGVENHGVIKANLGTVILAATNEYILDFYGDGLIHFGINSEVKKPAQDQHGTLLRNGVNNSGKIIANGGTVLLTAKTAGNILEHTVNMTGYVQAKSAVQKDGTIILMAGDQGNVHVEGKLIASGNENLSGGKVQVLGKKIYVAENSEINVSGKSGGEILIGGDYQGKNPAILNAMYSTIAKDAVLNANAISGNGGKVIIWADDTTQFSGMIYARGGTDHGNGGFIETSGKKILQVSGGKVDASAPFGDAGTWLLDPSNVNITTASDSRGSFNGGSPTNIYTPDGTGTANADADTIIASLSGGTNVTITTTSADTQAGNIALQTPLTIDMGGNTATLSLLADGTITNSAGNTITASNGMLNILFNSVGNTTISAAITTNGGYFSTTSNALTINAAINTNGGSFTNSSSSLALNSAINTAGGTVTSTTQNATTLGNAGGTTPGTINSGSGTITINTNADGAGANNFLMNANSTITTTNSSSSAVGIFVNAAGTGTGTATLRDITTGSGGTITVATDTGANTTGSDILYGGAGTLDVDTGTVTLSTPKVAGRNIATSAAPLQIKAATLNATSGNAGIFVTNTGASTLTLDTLAAVDTSDVAAGAGQVISNTAIQQGVNPINVTTLTLKTLNDLGANITFNSDSNKATTINLQARNAADSANAVGAISYHDTDGFAISGINTGSTLSLSAGGSITQTGILTVSGTPTFTVTTSSADILLSTQANDFAITPIFTNNGNIQDLGLRNINESAVVPTLPTGIRNLTLIFDAAAIALPGTTLTGTLTATANGAITQTGTLSGTTLTAKTLNNSGAAITLSNSSNEFTTINLQARNAADSADAAGAINYQDASGFNITALRTSSDAAITSAGNVADSGAGTIIGGTATFAAGGNNITLNVAANDFNTLLVTDTNTGTFVDTNALMMGTSSLTTNLTLTANGAITQSGILTVGGTTTLTAGAANNITLNNSSNNFSTIRAVTANNVNFADTNSVILGASTISGTLDVTAGGNITQSGALTVTNTPTFTVTTPSSDILLSTQANTFSTTPVFTNNGNIRNLGLRNISASATLPTLPTGLQDLTITFNNAAISLPAIFLTGALNLIAGDAITQSGAISGTTLTAETNNNSGANITLANAGNEFTSVDLQSRNAADNADAAGTLSYQDASGFDIEAARSTSDASFVGAGNITDSGALLISGTATFAAGSANDITINTATNNFGTVIITNGNNVTLRDTNALALGASTISGAFSVTTGGALTQSGIISAANGTTTLIAGSGNDITLNNAANNFSTVAVTSGNNVSLADTNALALGVSTISGTLDVSAGGTISQTGTLTVTGTPTFTVTNSDSDVLLATSANNFNTTPVLTNNSNMRDIALRNTNASAAVPTLPTGLRDLTLIFNNTGISFPTLTLSGNLTATSGGTMTQSGALVIPGTTTLTAGTGNNIILSNAGNNFGTFSVVTGNNVIIEDLNALIFGDTTVSGALSVTTAGNITQSSGDLAITGLATFTAGLANDITLDTATNNFSTLAVNNTNNATFRDTNAIILDASSVANNFNITATGITQSGILSGNALIAKTLSNAGGAITLDTFANDFSSINLQSRNAADTAVDTGLLAYQDSNGFDIANIATASNSASAFSIRGNGTITDSGTISVNGTTTITAGVTNNVTLDDAANNFGTVSVVSGNNITLVDANALILGNMTISGGLTLSTGGALTDSGNVSVSGALTATTVGGITLNSAGNTINSFNPSNSGSGNITLVNTAPLTITGFSQSGGGTVSITNTGALDIADGVSLNTSNATLTINATDLNLHTTGNINSGSANTTITQNTASGSIGLGNATGTMTISGNELQRITTSNLSLIAPTDGQILVDGISSTQSDNISNLLTLTATAGTSGSITFQNNASTFKTLTANADNGISVNAGLTTNTGNLILNADVDDVADTNDTLSLGANINSIGSATFSATTGGIALTSPVIITSNGITLNNTVTGAQNFTLNSGSSNVVLNASGLNTNASTTIIGNNVTGPVNVSALSLNTSFANLTGFVNGASGNAAISMIQLLNTILPGTHFFDGIDMYRAPPPPPPPPPTVPQAEVGQIILPYSSYLLDESTFAFFDMDFLNIDLYTSLEALDQGKVKCASLGSQVVLCNDAKSQN